MKKWMVGLFLTIIGMVLLSACNNEKSNDKAEADSGDGYEATTIRLAYNLPQDHHVAVGIEDFAKKVIEEDMFYPVVVIKEKIVGEGNPRLKTVFSEMEKHGYKAH